MEEKPAADATPTSSSTSGSGIPPGEDKFMQATHKVVNALEQFVTFIYKAVRNLSLPDNFEPRFAIKTLDGTLAWARNTFPPDKFGAASQSLSRWGHAGLLTAQCVTLLYYVVAAIKLSDWVYLLHGIGIAALLVILQYAAERFMHAGDSLIQASPSRMNSGAFLDCLALLMAISGVLILIGFIMQAKRMNSWSPFWVGLGFAALCKCVAYIALNPSMANTTVSEGGTAGEEAIGIMSFFVKAVIRIVPLAFGIGSIIGTVALFIAIFSLVRDSSLAAGGSALRLIGFCACLPFGTYLVFVLYHLLIDVIRAILAIPERLDRR